MPRFILIEPSLNKLGGHYFEYSVEVLQAAEQAGYEPVLAINQQFLSTELFPSRWPVFPCFQHTSDRIHRIPRRVSLSGSSPKPRSYSAFAHRLLDRASDRFKSAISDLRYIRRWSRTHAFAQSCQELFDAIGFQPGDQVLCSTFADMDLLGLVRFLQRNPKSQSIDWHLQFHFSIYYGRDPDYAEQEDKIGKLRHRFRKALAAIPDHRLSFYTTTKQLTRQFNSLQVAEFETLNWSVGRRFQRHCEAPTGQPGRPLRLFCPGGVRREKGADKIRWLIDSLRTDWLDSKRVQLLFQSDQKRRAEAILDLPPDSVVRYSGEPEDEIPNDPVLSLPFPLDTEPYANAICSADIGLLLYDSDEYFARCSGILLELLTAGVPAIVPAGCWLADQIESANENYIDQLRQSATELGRWNQPDVLIAKAATIFEPKTPTRVSAKNLVVSVDPIRKIEPGCYIRFELKQSNHEGTTLCRQTQIVGCNSNDSKPSCLFSLEPDAERVHLSVSNPYGSWPLPAADLCVEWLDGPIRPLGLVGLTAADIGQVPRLIAEIVEHYDHYRTAAQQFAQRMIQLHDPSQTIRSLTASKVRRLAG